MQGTFSRRTAWDLTESGFARAVRERRQRGEPLIDLTRSNPTLCGFDYGDVLRPLAIEEALRYVPDARGGVDARKAVAKYYRDHGAAVGPEQVILTASTSEAYSHVFRLLCEAGDEVLVAQPSYPLFDYLADLTDVRVRAYPLFYDFGWWIDFAELERAVTERTRAIVVVHPNNPTGHGTSLRERRQLEEVCARHGLALIVDEVFLDYELMERGLGDAGEPLRSFACGEQPVLTFVLSGVSKVVALPQMKVGWMAALGPATVREEALGRLEMIADTYLSVNTPAQLALPHWLGERAGIQGQIRDRLQANLAVLRGAVLRGSGLEVLRLDGGWSAVLRLSAVGSDAGVAERLLEKGVLVHPGSFYGMAERNRVVVSLLGATEEMRMGVGKIVEEQEYL